MLASMQVQRTKSGTHRQESNKDALCSCQTKQVEGKARLQHSSRRTQQAAPGLDVSIAEHRSDAEQGVQLAQEARLQA